MASNQRVSNSPLASRLQRICAQRFVRAWDNWQQKTGGTSALDIQN